ncbi:MAG TPA: hypothetical protein PKM65_03700 [Spirochaetota bacterium]|nr:hypothetical protein [Spirochaetota bacterium]HNT10811.1 hypothetical protein [Spirochaetota bacterium]HNV47937.1 hypothetical protein [Spirochaetota bacterium]HOS41516.1 hypothetical protein [Spirochaetota bacterium]HPI22511.1 hypothetical protein [Spirochaetota bacterium]
MSRHVLMLTLAASVIATGVLAPPAAAPSRVGRAPEGPIVRTAHGIVTAAVRSVRTFRREMGPRACWEDVVMELVVRRVVKGALREGMALSFSYRVLLDDAAPCPRLYYVNPPHAALGESVRSGAREIIAAVERLPGSEQYRVTGTFDIERMEWVRATMR